MTTEKKLLAIDEASQATGLSVSFLRKLIFERAIPFVKIGRRIYFDSTEINVWINDHRVTAQGVA